MKVRENGNSYDDNVCDKSSNFTWILFKLQFMQQSVIFIHL